LSLSTDVLKNVTIRSANSEIRGKLAIAGRPAVQAGSSPDQNDRISEASFTIPGTVAFFHSSRTQVPAFLRIAPKGTIDLRDLHVKELAFAKENADPEAPFQSGIVSGNVTMLSTGEQIKLERGSRLRLVDAEGIVSQLAIGPDGVVFSFEGKVRSALLGPPGFDHELKPSWLDYFFRQQRLYFFWGAVSFLWALLWSGRTLLFK
jgi:hypothetical protein